MFEKKGGEKTWMKNDNAITNRSNKVEVMFDKNDAKTEVPCQFCQDTTYSHALWSC